MHNITVRCTASVANLRPSQKGVRRIMLLGGVEEFGATPAALSVEDEDLALLQADRYLVVEVAKEGPPVSKKILAVLEKKGFDSQEAIAAASDEDLAAIEGLGPKKIKDLRSWAEEQQVKSTEE